MVGQKNNIRLRCLRPSDTEKVIDMFVKETAHGPESPRGLALAAHPRLPRSMLQYFFVILGLAITYQSPAYRYIGFGISLTSASLYLFYWHFTSEIYLGFIRNSKQKDLVDLTGYYKLACVGTQGGEDIYEPLGPDGFWVIEEILPDGGIGEMVGMIALDCSPRDGIVQGELRRMVVSSRHRRMGIGKVLLETLLAHARKHGLPAVWLGTSEYQTPARVMYERYGWVEVRREPLKEAWGLVTVDMVWYKLGLTYT